MCKARGGIVGNTWFTLPPNEALTGAALEGFHAPPALKVITMTHAPSDPAETNSESWVVSPAYEGQNRRRRRRWFSLRAARLDDAGAEVDVDAQATETLLRRLSVWTGISAADRDGRAEYVATLEALARKGRREGQRHWPDIIDASARYVRSAGAQGPIDEPLLTDAVLAANRAHYENALARPAQRLIQRLLNACRGD